MDASLWTMGSALAQAARDIEECTESQTMSIALRMRHCVEQGCTDILRRLPRADGPYPLAMDHEVSQQYQELDLYLKQTHGERELEALGHSVSQGFPPPHFNCIIWSRPHR